MVGRDIMLVVNKLKGKISGGGGGFFLGSFIMI